MLSDVSELVESDESPELVEPLDVPDPSVLVESPVESLPEDPPFWLVESCVPLPCWLEESFVDVPVLLLEVESLFVLEDPLLPEVLFEVSLFDVPFEVPELVDPLVPDCPDWLLSDCVLSELFPLGVDESVVCPEDGACSWESCPVSV